MVKFKFCLSKLHNNLVCSKCNRKNVNFQNPGEALHSLPPILKPIRLMLIIDRLFKCCLGIIERNTFLMLYTVLCNVFTPTRNALDF